MTNPYDEVKRICRDPIRKLGYDDRLFGAIREAVRQNVYPKILAKGVLGGISYLINNKIDADFSCPNYLEEVDEQNARTTLKSIWKDNTDRVEREQTADIVCSELSEFIEEFVHVKK